MKKYIRIARPDHWIKQLFILPGVVCAIVLAASVSILTDAGFWLRLVAGFFSTCATASANYVINEWLDAEFDKFHPVKKHRSVVENDLKKSIVYAMYIGLTIVGFLLGYLVCMPLLLMQVWLWVMGILYNVKPVRTKDVPFVDVLTESLNNAIRLLMGWFIVTHEFLPPSSIVIGYWMAGAFLMATKRYSEYRMIGNAELTAKYRKSFKGYTEHSLMLSAFFYAMCSVFLVGVFLIKYRVELLLIIPFIIGLFCYYFWISFKEDSAAQKPEKLYREKGLMLYVLVLILLFVILMCVDIPGLDIFMTDALIQI